VFDWVGILLLGVIVALVWRQERKWIESQLVEEVSPETFSLMTSWSRWQGLRWSKLLQGDVNAWRRLRHIRQTATELAFAKQRWRRSGGDEQLEKQIAENRQRLALLTEQGKSI
jgi:hypothetical protein